ncbi:MAG: low molecular weight protein-tyrosine-phosphatase [Verrucomicrobiales bacterium]
MPKRVLFVCLGNICRSPAADIVFRELVKKRGLAGLSCDSAGTSNYHPGKKPDARMSATLEKRGYPIVGTARQITRADLDEFDLILTMDDENLHNVRKLARTEAQKERIRPFTDFCTRHSQKEVPDPYYGGQDGFELVADLIEDGCEGLLNDLVTS